MGGRLPCIIFCSSVTFRQACRETKWLKAPRHCLYTSSLPHCTCRCRHKSRLGGPGRPPAVHESHIQNGEHISYNWVNFSSLVTAVVRTPQLVCILCTLKTKPNVRSILVINIPKPNGCLDRSASRANHCEYQPNQTSDSLFST